MIRWGISAGTHDASITVMRSDRVVLPLTPSGTPKSRMTKT